MPNSNISSNDSLNLTFGVEIECVVKVSNAQFAFLQSNPFDDALGGYQDDEERVLEAVYHELIDGGILCFKPGSPAKEYDRWKVTTDATIRIDGTHDDEYKYFGVELISRILRPSLDDFKEIEKVIVLIGSRFIVETDISTGLHVHVGNRRDGFPFHTLWWRLSTSSNPSTRTTGLVRMRHGANRSPRTWNCYVSHISSGC